MTDEQLSFEVFDDEPGALEPEIHVAETYKPETGADLDEEPDSNLIAHARRELEIIGASTLGESVYDTMIAEAVIDLISVFAKQGHSGGSAQITIEVFHRLAKYENLTPLTDDPDEWHFHGEEVSGYEGGLWQNKRNSAMFSHDGGKTYHNVHDLNVEYTSESHAQQEST